MWWIGPGIVFFGVFEKFETFFLKICAHSEWYRNILAGIFEILTFYGNIAFPLSPVLGCLWFTKFCWVGNNMNIIMKPSNSPTQGQPNPKKNQVNNAIWAHLFPQQIIFLGLRLVLYRKQTTTNLTPTKFSANTLSFFSPSFSPFFCCWGTQ